MKQNLENCDKQNTTAESKNEPIKENTNVSSGNANQKDGGFIAMLINEVKDLLRNPKKLLPTIILSIVWMLFSIMSAMGANIPILRFLYTLTYSNGGMFGGFSVPLAVFSAKPYLRPWSIPLFSPWLQRRIPLQTLQSR